MIKCNCPCCKERLHKARISRNTIYKNNPEVREKKIKDSIIKQREGRKNLADHYVKVKLKRQGIPNKDITPELIILKRKQLLLTRDLKQLKHAKKDK